MPPLAAMPYSYTNEATAETRAAANRSPPGVAFGHRQRYEEVRSGLPTHDRCRKPDPPRACLNSPRWQVRSQRSWQRPRQGTSRRSTARHAPRAVGSRHAGRRSPRRARRESPAESRAARPTPDRRNRQRAAPRADPATTRDCTVDLAVTFRVAWMRMVPILRRVMCSAFQRGVTASRLSARRRASSRRGHSRLDPR